MKQFDIRNKEETSVKITQLILPWVLQNVKHSIGMIGVIYGGSGTGKTTKSNLGLTIDEHQFDEIQTY